MQVTIYSTTTCPYCKMLKKYLDEKKISYTEKLVDQDDAAREEMMTKSGGYLGVPFTVIGRDGQEMVVMGFDKHKLNEIFGLTA
ncbi:glutaredoxin family protein [Patescibacteria group bacterium]